jgi:aspartyl-tRNA synthetase
MHKYRTHTCNELRLHHTNNTVRLSGWVHRKRDHGNLLFIDLRDHYGITQCTIENDSLLFNEITNLKNESVITVTGKVIARTAETTNSDLQTGEIELIIEEYILDSEANLLPIQVNSDREFPEETRLKYRFLDLRRDKLHKNIMLRASVIKSIRDKMTQAGFTEFQTPILTASSPEGARDFLVPSRIHPGKFYALPQAPQQFKQLLMVSGFDKYFQIAPCFRDEDPRADRSPGEFYQLDIEMSFVEQEDIFQAIEPVIYEVFKEHSSKEVSSYPFKRISFEDSMLKYGNDKPDLRNPLTISDVTDIFRDSDFTIFKKNIEQGMVVRAIPAPKVAEQPRSFFDKKIEFAQENGAPGLGYIIFSSQGEAKGPIAKFLNPEKLEAIKKVVGVENGDAVFFASDKKDQAAKLAGKVRTLLGEELDLIDKNKFEFCWIIDFPFFEWNEDEKRIDFLHNPFSMPQGGIEALNKATTTEDLLNIKAFQYDIVCNGVELSSGAIRNHKPDLMYKAFAIVGYSQAEVDLKFGGMINAFKFGAPPHGGVAPGIDRIVMLLADAENIREVIAFPMNQKAEDLMMNAPSSVEEKQLRDLNIKLNLSDKLKKALGG